MPKEDHSSSDRAFDDLARALAEGSISRRRALKLFAGTAIAALIPSRALAQQQKVTICHKPDTPDQETIEVSPSAVATHLRHGDQRGSCCPDGRVRLSNGTCVLERPPDACFCPETCFCRFEHDPEFSTDPRVFCASEEFVNVFCPNGHSQCPEGQFCEETGAPFGPVCAMAC
jgi:hypothetical protein